MELAYTVRSAGGRSSRVQVGAHTLQFNIPDGTGKSGPGPLAVFVAAAGACAHYFAGGVLEREGLPTEWLEVDVRALTNPRPRAHIETITVTVRLDPRAARLQDAVRAAVEGCPVHGTFCLPPDASVEVVVAAPVRA